MHLARYSSRLDLPFIFFSTPRFQDDRLESFAKAHVFSDGWTERERDRKKEDATRRRERDGGFTGGRFRVEMIGVRSVSKRDRNEDRDACSTHFSIEASPRASCPLGWPNKTNAFLMDRGQTRAAPLALVLLGRVHAWLRSRTSHSSSHRRLGNENISGADGNESEEVIDVTR